MPNEMLTSDHCPSNGRNQHISRYRGVGVHRSSGKWTARIGVDGKQRYLGTYDTAEEAAVVYNQAAVELFGQGATLNALPKDTPLPVRRTLSQAKQGGMPTGESGYKGVVYQKTSGKWIARIMVRSQRLHLGSYDTADEAAAVYNQAAAEHFGDRAILNELPAEAPPPARSTATGTRQHHHSSGVSGYKGVLKDKPSGKWMARITVAGSVHYLGTYATPEEAALAYNRAALKHFGKYALLNTLPTDRSPLPDAT